MHWEARFCRISRILLSFVFSHSVQGILLALRDSFQPSLLLLLAFSHIFLLRITALQPAAWTTTTGRHHCLAASACVTRKTCFPSCFLLCATSTLAVVPGEMPVLAAVEDGSSGGDPLRRGKGGETCVVSAAFTLAEKNGCKTGAGVQPSEFWKISKASLRQERTHGSCVWR